MRTLPVASQKGCAISEDEAYTYVACMHGMDWRTLRDPIFWSGENLFGQVSIYVRFGQPPPKKIAASVPTLK